MIWTLHVGFQEANVRKFHTPKHRRQDTRIIRSKIRIRIDDHGKQRIVTILDSWLTPDKFPAHSDARVMITGTKGMIETVQYPEISVKVVSDDLEPRTVELLQPKNSQAKELLTILTNQDIPTILKPTDAIQSTELALEVQAMAEKR